MNFATTDTYFYLRVLAKGSFGYSTKTTFYLLDFANGIPNLEICPILFFSFAPDKESRAILDVVS